MTQRIKSGQELLDEFFLDVGKLDGVDQDTLETIVRLYADGKLTNTNITNKLDSMRKAKLSSETDEN